MAKPGHPVSESYKPVCCSLSHSVSFCDETEFVGLEEEDDQSPIFSISKSSTDVVVATGPLQKRDQAWARMNMRRSSSTNTHSEQDSAILHQLRSHVLQRVSGSTSSQHLPLTTHNLDMHGGDMQDWSESSGNAHSRSSTPETVVWKGGASCFSSLSQEVCCPSVPESPMSKLISPPSSPSLFTSSLHVAPAPPEDLLNSNHKEQSLMSSSATSPLQVHTSSSSSNSPTLLQLTSTGGESVVGNNFLSFQFLSPVPPSVCLVEGNAVSDVGPLFEDFTKELHDPGDLIPELPEDRESGGPGLLLSSPIPASATQGGECCRCKLIPRASTTRPPQDEMMREEGTMTSQVVLVDAQVQTISPIGSWWDLRRNISSSIIGSHSILGSPPGSRLNLKSVMGSNSNLVSPSSSMFPVSCREEEEQEEERHGEGRRSCLKIQGREREEMGRRSSMKQVQWDEDGMTWDVHGASVDPEVLSTAIKKHLELQNSPRPLRPSTKKTRAPKPPLVSVVKAKAPELNQLATSTFVMEGEGGESKQMEEEGGGIKDQTPEVSHVMSRAEGENTKEEEDDEVYGEEGSSPTNSPMRGIVHTRKKSVIRSLRRPGWCGSSRKANN